MPRMKDAQQTPQIGERIRHARKGAGLTLKNLAAMTGLSGPYLSQMENGRVNINVTHLESISRALGVPIVSLFADDDSPRVSETRRLERRWFDLGDGAQESLLIKGLGNLETFTIRLPSGADTLEQSSHPGEEFTFVITGRVRLLLNGDQVHDLDEGDILYYLSEIPHRWLNVTDGDSEILVVNTPATY